MKAWRRGKARDAQKAAQSESTDSGADELLALLPPDRREAVRLAARRTPRLLLTEGAFNTTLSEEIEDEKRLVEVLATDFPDPHIIESIVARSGLRLEMIRMGGSPVSVWTAVLRQAVLEDKIDVLLDEALTTSSDPRLSAAARHYREVRAS